jgi:hypothetical protein
VGRLSALPSIHRYLESTAVRLGDAGTGNNRDDVRIVLGIALIAGISTPLVAALSGCLLLAFAAGMTVGTGVKAALDASVLAASAAVFLLALISSSRDHP